MDFKLLLGQFKKFFANMSKQQRIILFSSLGGLFFAIILLTVIGSKVEYSTLFTNLSPQDASSITAYLDQKKVDYKLVGSTTIKVPKSQVYRIRLDLVSAGLPKHGVVGFEIFDKQNFGTTNFVENINYIRALEGELVRTIESMNDIKSARIHLAIPKPTVFVDKEANPTASVVLDLYSPLSLRQVIAIQKLVASSVPKLSYKDVTVVDSSGNLLSKKMNEDEFLTGNEIKYKDAIQKIYLKKINNFLTPILGKSKFVATVDIDLDLSKVTKKSVTYDPNSVVRSEQNEESTNMTPQNKGVPGVVSNVKKNETAPSSSSSKSTHTKTITNFEIGHTETVTEEPLFKIKKISAVVIADGTYIPIKDKNGKITDYKYKPLDAATVSMIKDAVMKAVGYDKSRGDQVSVSSMKFQVDQKYETVKKMDTKSLIVHYSSYYRYIVIALFILLFYFLFLRKFIKNALKIHKIESDSVDEDLAEASKATGKSVGDIEKELSEKLESESAMSEEAMKSKVMEDKLREEADKNPEEIANLIKTLISTSKKG